MTDVPPNTDPGFDARLEYNQTLGELMKALNVFVATGNYDTWRRALTQLVNINPYLEESEKTVCDKNLAAAAQYLQFARSSLRGRCAGQQKAFYNAKAEQALNEATRTVFIGMKKHDMLLPKKNNQHDFDDNELERLMGLA